MSYSCLVKPDASQTAVLYDKIRHTLFRFDQEHSIIGLPLYGSIGEAERVLFDFRPPNRWHREKAEQFSDASLQIVHADLRMLASFPIHITLHGQSHDFSV
jgi:hypothetical protein